MRSFVKVVALSLFAGICIAQQGVDPAYLQQYYQQVASQAGHRAAANVNPEVTPIFESNPDLAQQYIAQQQPQQIRIKDIAQDQVRAQQQQTPQHTQAYIAPSVRQYLQHQPQPQVQYVSQPQAVQYKPAPAKQNLLRPRPQPEEYESPAGKLNKEEDYDPNPSYQFGFDVKDDEFTNYQNRKEVRDGNVIKGSYSVVDSDGFIRTVKYTADPKEGFKAEVIREPTDIVVKIPTPPPHTQLISQQAGAQQYLRQAPPSSRYQEKAPQPQYQYQQ